MLWKVLDYISKMSNISTLQDKEYISEPWNFSWVIEDKLCASAWPQTRANVLFLQ